MYLESACHNEQNGNQKFVLRPGIAAPWQLKVCKVEKIVFSYLRLAYGNRVFSDAAKNITIFSSN